MTVTTAAPLERVPAAVPVPGTSIAPLIAGAVAFLVLFYSPLITLVGDWWSDPDAGHGLLLAPVSLYIMWKRGVHPAARPQRVLGLTLLLFAVVLRYLSGLAAEMFTLRASVLAAVIALVIYVWGMRQVIHLWLPFTLLALSIPLPSVLTGTLALPLQFQASRLGAALLDWRHVPVLLSGNVLHLPERALFVTEACSGLRSLTSLLALGVLISGLWLKLPVLRAVIILLAIPIAVFLNGVRVFLTGFLVYFVDPKLGDGLMHYTEGWVIFVVAFGMLGAVAWALVRLEQRWSKTREV